METLTIIRIIGYVLLGVAAGYLGSMGLRGAAANRFLANRRMMAIFGAAAGITLAIIANAAHEASAPPLAELGTINNLNDALAQAAEKPVVLNFYAEWCPPSRKLLPDMERLQRAYGKDVHIYRINVDEALALREQLGIRSIPTLVYLQRGQEVDRTIGLIGPQSIVKRIDNMIEIAQADRPVQ